MPKYLPDLTTRVSPAESTSHCFAVPTSTSSISSSSGSNGGNGGSMVGQGMVPPTFQKPRKPITQQILEHIEEEEMEEPSSTDEGYAADSSTNDDLPMAPDSASDDEGKSAETVLPAVVWKEVFGKVDSRNLVTCWMTCAAFRKVLTYQKPVILFRKVFPSLFIYLDGTSVLNCRSVCKEWNDVVDSFLENHPHMRPYREKDTVTMDGYYFDSVGSPSRSFIDPLSEKRICHRAMTPALENEMRDHPRNPFVGKTLILTPEYVSADWASCMATLEKFGSHVYYLNIKNTLRNSSIPLIVLNMFPNLRRLDVTRNLHPIDDGRWFDQENLNKLPNLETVKVVVSSWGYRDMGLLMGFIGRHSAQLKRLEVIYHFIKRLAPNDWSNLVELRLLHFNPVLGYNLVSQLKLCQLKRLELQFEEDPGYPKHCLCDFLSNLLDCINSLASNTKLSVVRISGPLALFDVEPCKIVDIQTASSSLKTLEIAQTGAAPFSFNFLLCFPFLKFLHLMGIAGTEMDFGQDLQIVKIRSCNNGNMYASNVWKLIPQLEVLTFNGKRFDRETYKKSYESKMDANNVDEEIDGADNQW